MDLVDFSKGQAWSIVPEKFETLARKFHDFKASKSFSKEIAAYTGKSRGEDLYEIKKNAAVIPVNGSLSKRSSFFSWLFGGSSYQQIAKSFSAALEDPAVDAIVLSIDSPGGTVNGVEAVGDLIFNARGIKPIVAFGNGMMASAAYWLGSAADMVIAESTTDVGSIGVLMVHVDYSVADAKFGVKITYLSAGKYKALGNDAEPLSQQAREMFQAELDYIYGIFVDTVSRNRGVDSEEVKSKMADGKIFIGRQAQQAGLVDKIGNLDAAIESALSMVDQTQLNQRRIIMPEPKNSNVIETIEQLSAAYPDLVSQIREQGVKSVDTDKIKTGAVASEKDRILGLVGIQFGEEAGEKFKAIVDTGVSVEQFKAVREANPVQPENAEAAALAAGKDELLKAIHVAGSENPGAAAQQVNTGGKDFMSLVAEHRQLNKCGQVEAMKAVMKQNPEAHKAYIQKAN